jgi:hypothetical protein
MDESSVSLDLLYRGIPNYLRMVNIMKSNIVSNEKNQEAPKAKRSGMTPLAIVISVLWTLLIGLFTAGAYLNVWGGYSYLGHTVAPWVGDTGIILFLVLLINPLLRIVLKKWITREDLVAISILSAVGSIFAAILGGMYYVMNTISALSYRAMTRPDLYDPFIERFSSLLIIKDMDAVTGYWHGTGERIVPWNVWIGPIITWTLFVGVLLWVSVCLASILRKRWTEEERLTYPLAGMKLQLIGEPCKDEGRIAEMWKNPTAIVGVVIGFLLMISPALHKFIPAIPAYDERWFREILGKATSGTGGLYDSVYTLGYWRLNPAAVGLMFFAPLDLIFSTWFFSLIRIIRNAYYLNTKFMAAGTWNLWGVGRTNVLVGFIGLGLTYLFLMRRDLGLTVKSAFGKIDTSETDAEEAMSRRKAFWGLVIGSVAILFFELFFLKMNFIWSLLMVIAYIAISISIARLRAEAAVGWQNNIQGRYHEDFIMPIFGLGRLGENSLMGLSFIGAWGASSNGSVTAMTLEGFRMADEANIKRSSVVKGMVAFGILGVLSAWFFALPYFYEYGANLAPGGTAMRWGPRGFTFLSRFNSASSLKPEPLQQIHSVITLGGVFVLSLLRARFIWWPFHPIGFLIGDSVLGMDSYQAAAFLAWVIKFLVMRWGGNAWYKKVSPFFYGLIGGSMLAGAIDAFLFTFL